MSKLLRHTSCTKCNSSDALAVYLNADGTKSAYCFSCQYTIKNYEIDTTFKVKRMYKPQLTLQEIQLCPFADKRDRKISPEVVERFGIRATINQTTGQQDAHFYPYHIKGQLSGYKSRVLPKDFSSLGAIGSIKGCDLFGQHLCKAGGIKILITEGEEDCLAAYRILDAYNRAKGTTHAINVVSLVNGISSAASEIEKALPFLTTFKEIILCLDQDKAGKQALASIASLLELDQFKVMHFTEKDASDMLVKGKQKEFVNAFFNAEKWQPGNIVNISSLEETLFNTAKPLATKYPEKWGILNHMTYGRRLGELDVFTAGTGGGKSQLFKELLYHDLFNTNYKLASIALEESIQRSNEMLIGLHLNKRIHLPDVYETLKKDDLLAAFRELSMGDRIEFYDQGRDMTDLTLLSQIRYMAAGLGCKHIYLDHLNMIISETASHGDERKRIDELMTKLKNIAKELNVWIGLIVHLSKTSKGTVPFELGAIPSVDDLRGSGSLKQVSDTVIAVQRNGNHSIESMRDVLRLHVIKNRFSGTRGPADFLRFSQETGRLEKTASPEHDIIESSRKKFTVDDGDF